MVLMPFNSLIFTPRWREGTSKVTRPKLQWKWWVYQYTIITTDRTQTEGHHVHKIYTVDCPNHLYTLILMVAWKVLCSFFKPFMQPSELKSLWKVWLLWFYQSCIWQKFCSSSNIAYSSYLKFQQKCCVTITYNQYLFK